MLTVTTEEDPFVHDQRRGACREGRQVDGQKVVCHRTEGMEAWWDKEAKRQSKGGQLRMKHMDMLLRCFKYEGSGLIRQCDPKQKCAENSKLAHSRNSKVTLSQGTKQSTNARLH